MRGPGFLLLCCLAMAVLCPPGARGEEPGQREQAKKKSLGKELPRIPPVAAERALATFTVQGGFRLELVAAEPLVADPVDACFDADGRLYVAQMHGYPFSQEPTRLNPKGGGKPDAGVIRLLEDTNGDGRFDKSVRFADKIRWPTSVCCYDGGVFVLAPPHIHYFKDTDGDGVADVRRIVFSGFERGNVQSVANNMKWGLDNRITLAAGRNGGKLSRDGRPVLAMGRVDISFDPRELDVRPLTGGVQFGNSFDAWGNRFVCSNSNHIQHVLLSREYLSRHPGLSPPASIRSIAAGGAAAPVFRKSPAEPWRVVRTRRRVSDPKTKARLPRTEQFAIGFFTSATSVTIYTGDAYPEPFRGNAFIGDVGGNLVHRKTMEAVGPSFVARRAEQRVEFLTSTDNWFRPTNFVNGPDGTLYLLDMYRETIEHPYSIPEDIKKFLDLESGDDRGRIYRLVPPGWERPERERLSKASTEYLLGALESENGWHRRTAHRLLWERQDPGSVEGLVETAGCSESPLARAHSLYILDGMAALDDEVLARGLIDTSPRVREHALRLADDRLGTEPIASKLETLARDTDPRVRYQLAFTLGTLAGQARGDLLFALATHDPADAHLRLAVLTSSQGFEPRLVASLLGSPTFLASPAANAWLGDLARLVGASGPTVDAATILSHVLAEGQPAARRAVVLGGLGAGLARRGKTVQAVLVDEATPAAVRTAAEAVFRAAVSALANPQAARTDRLGAVAVLGFADAGQAVPALAGVLAPREPQSLQRAAVAALARHPSPETSRALLAGWRGHGPVLRADIVDVLIQRPAGTTALLDAVAAKRVLVGDVTLDKRQVLSNHPDSRLRDRARKLLQGVASPDRAKVIARYRPSVEKLGDAAAGAAVFKKQCATCHRVGAVGHQLGPDLVSVRNKSPADLLVNILDPNREAQPNFMTYTLVTTQGRVLTGMIAAETGTTVTLRRAEGKQDVVARSSIEVLVSNGKSLMPEGLEKELSPRQAADVIAWIRSLKPPEK